MAGNMSFGVGDIARLARLLKRHKEVSLTQTLEILRPDDKLAESLADWAPPAQLQFSLSPPTDLMMLGQPLLPAKRARYLGSMHQQSEVEHASTDEEEPFKAFKLSSNGRQLEQALRRVVELSETDEDDRLYEEHYLAKLQARSLALTDKHYVGLRRSDIYAVAKYRLNPEGMPKLARSFPFMKVEDLSNLLSKNETKANSANKQVGSLKFKKLTTCREYPTQPSRAKPHKADKLDTQLVKKAWSYIIKKYISKAHRALNKSRNELRTNSKRFAQLCSKEVGKKANKMVREAKEATARGKRLQREVVTFWKRREKETTEMKRKREKEEMETRKKWEEEQESIRQRNRLEFLMRQSDIYTHFMAHKLGISYSIPSNISSIPVDEEQARESVKQMIERHQEHMQQYGGERTLSTEDLSQVGLLGLDKVEEGRMFSRIDGAPTSFVGDLKEYQTKGLRWLDNLYELGINGILADEMGLGKTIQAIALLAHLSSSRGIWGPFLVVCPSSTLHNWQAELSRFCPSLKVLPYWGGIKERKALRKYMSPRKAGNSESPFHVCVTSYQMVLTDDKVFQKLKWQYMILDEAQAIKNVATIRWNVLLGFSCRNRLLLTGTPIQNSMAELWALLHFIMPQLFDSHEQFQEWFSKDIEAHSQDAGALNQHQLQRLHTILKPFMLRRIKKDVENEIGQKTEIEIFCEMTSRQRVLYSRIKRKLNISDLFTMADSKAKVENLMNLMMQFRKVCNHPDLFERRPEHTPVTFRDLALQFGSCTSAGFNQLPEVWAYNHSPITLWIPRVVYQEIWLSPAIQPSIYDPKEFSWLRLLGRSLTDLDRFTTACDLVKAALAASYLWRLKEIADYEYLTPPLLCIALLGKDLPEVDRSTLPILSNIYKPAVLAAPVQVSCSSNHFTHHFAGPLYSPYLKRFVFGEAFKPANVFAAKGHIGPRLPVLEGSLDMPNYVELAVPLKLLHDSAKLKSLDELLRNLSAEGHRVLIFCQMTRMLDILEDYLYLRKHSYLRMDGSTPIGERRDLIDEFQKNSSVFVFILSTRAGGLGVNLTAADTVIFYDIDWNPTMDAQATDRVHRIGQTKAVTVYRLITSRTVEERILRRAKQKQTVQSTVYAGGAFKADYFKPNEVAELLLDDNEIENAMQTSKFMGLSRKKKSKKNEDGEAYNISEFVDAEIN
jgi:DNA helicase INO80